MDATQYSDSAGEAALEQAGQQGGEGAAAGSCSAGYRMAGGVDELYAEGYWADGDGPPTGSHLASALAAAALLLIPLAGEGGPTSITAALYVASVQQVLLQGSTAVLQA